MKCGMIVTSRIFKAVCTEQEFNKYEDQVMKSFVDLSQTTIWCPGTDCGKIVENVYTDAVEVQCTSCSIEFCFKCASEPHMPITCEMLEDWKKELASDDAAKKWIIRNTKKCPNCKVPVQKNGGCNHISCGSCGHGFCWLCLGDKETHGGTDAHIRQCNSIEDAIKRGAKMADLMGDSKKEDLYEEFEAERSNFYKYRYNSHQDSLDFNRKHLKTTEERCMTQSTANPIFRPHDFQFIIDIAKLVIKARRMLSYSYVYRFYLKGMNKQTFFDFIQGQLEQQLEVLNQHNEAAWLDYIELDKLGKPYLGEKWSKFKMTLVAHREATEVLFDKMTASIYAGLVEVADEADENDEMDYNFAGKNMTGKKWICSRCKQLNDPQDGYE